MAALGELHLQGVDILQAVPVCFSGGRVDAPVTYPRKDTRALCKKPHCVVFGANPKHGNMHDPDATEKVVLCVLIAGEIVGVVLAAEEEEDSEPYQTVRTFDGRWSGAAGDLPLLPRGWCFRGVRTRR